MAVMDLSKKLKTQRYYAIILSPKVHMFSIIVSYFNSYLNFQLNLVFFLLLSCIKLTTHTRGATYACDNWINFWIFYPKKSVVIELQADEENFN